MSQTTVREFNSLIIGFNKVSEISLSIPKRCYARTDDYHHIPNNEKLSSKKYLNM